MTFETWFKSQYVDIPIAGALSVLELTKDGGTVPFIARYRKENTGNLDEVAIQKVITANETWNEIIKRQAFILETIEAQKKLTPELKDKILTTFVLDQLEDIYLPYKQKKKTKAIIAKEAGLEPLALWIWDVGHNITNPAGVTIEQKAAEFLNKDKNIETIQHAITGATDIITERLSETADLRQQVREITFKDAQIKSVKGKDAKDYSKFEKYFDASESIQRLMKPENSHRYLAMRRGWMEGELSLTVTGAPDNPDFETNLVSIFIKEATSGDQTIAFDILKKASSMALKVYVFPSIDKEVHKMLKTAADEAAIKVFAENVRTVLLAPPYGSKNVLGVDPGIRTGCKLAIVDSTGKYINNTVIHLESGEQMLRSQKVLLAIIKEFSISAIAVGNGTAGRETETFIRKIIQEAGLTVPVVMVSESGASIYSASEVAREEFPDLDLTVRGAISIARRLQDPLSELVKVDAKSIGVGQYQHDVSQTELKKSLDNVVDSSVNSVGVALNNASAHLLAHVSGIGPSLAKGIVEFRSKKGIIKSRDALLEIPRFTKKVFEQAAGFLRIPESENPLDNTGVHPEKYTVLEEYAKKLNKNIRDLLGKGVDVLKQSKELKAQIGEFTFADVVSELEKPGRDPRQQLTIFQFRDDIHSISDLKPGIQCPGIVTNVTNFGAFVDIGVHQDGLVHISELSNTFVKDPKEVVNPGDQVKVQVMEVDVNKKRISLTMKINTQNANSSASTNNSQQFKSQDKKQQFTQQKQQPTFSNNSFSGLAGLKINKK